MPRCPARKSVVSEKREEHRKLKTLGRYPLRDDSRLVFVYNPKHI